MIMFEINESYYSASFTAWILSTTPPLQHGFLSKLLFLVFKTNPLIVSIKIETNCG